VHSRAGCERQKAESESRRLDALPKSEGESPSVPKSGSRRLERADKPAKQAC
jgi:hypothetical protein